MDKVEKDFSSEEKLEQLIEKKTSENFALKKLLEELNKKNGVDQNNKAKVKK